MQKRKVLTAALAGILAVAMIGGCASTTGGGERPEVEGSSGEGGNEHGPAGASGSGNGTDGTDGGEEGGSMLALDETFDKVRNGARLVLSYHAAQSAFIGTVQNTTTATLQEVRVEVHLSNGVELGPTEPVDLPAGATHPVTLDAAGQTFTGWVPHAEVGPQSGAGGEGGGEHGPGGEGGGS